MRKVTCFICKKPFMTQTGACACPECTEKALAEAVRNDSPVEEKEAGSIDTRAFNVGSSDYSKHKIQPWDIWIEYKLNPFDADIVKRVLRHKKTDSRKMDYEKIIHICQERIRQIENNEDVWEEK